MKHHKVRPEDNLYLLAFIDISDRLDILLLEIRHLQQSIIHYLRAPTLYLPLRYEEEYIFGENWDEYFKKGSTITYDIQLVKKWVIRYPTPRAAIRTYSEHKIDTSESNDIQNRIRHVIHKRVGQIWMGDNWARDQRAQYHALYALQLLKQRILRDKVAIYRAAVEARLAIWTSHPGELDKAAFMILRQAVIDNADRYVSILSNHKQQLSQSIDFGMPSDPHPSTERRREMGIYMDFLSNRTQDIQRDILHLLGSFKHSAIKKDASRILMFHGWSQDTRVTNFHLFDKTNYLHNKYRQDKKAKRHVGYVNTSFWTPDRPDLHPIIAHEIADSVNKNALGRIDDVSLSDREDAFTHLLIDLKSTLFKHAKNNHHLAFIKEESTHYIQQIASDLLAASVKGVSYLYALFLLRVGDTLHNQLKAGAFIKLDMVYSLKEGTASFDDSLLWYLRLTLTTAWIKASLHIDPSELDTIVLEGVKHIANELLVFLDQHAPQTRVKRARHWQRLAADMSQQIQKSKAVHTCKKWRKKRSEDDWVERCGKPGKRRFARSTRRLNIRLQNYLFRELLAQKRSQGKPLYNKKSIESLDRHFNRVYPLDIATNDIPNVDNKRSLQHPTSLFRHMYDIPYQSAILRSVDILYEKISNHSFFQQLRWDMELGRGLFAVALEFHARETESSEYRLALCVNQIAYIYKELDNTQLRTALSNWLNLEKSHTLYNKQDSPGKKQAISTRKIRYFCKHIHTIDANEITKTFSYFRPIYARQIRRLEELAGYKLQELLSILERHMPAINNTPDIYNQLCALIQFLSIRRQLSKNKKAEPKTLFYDHMLAAMGDIPVFEKQAYEKSHILHENHLPKRVPSVMIHRLSMTNYYPVPDPANLDGEDELAPHNNPNGLTFSDSLKKDRWVVNYQTPQSEKERSFSNTWIVLGRFDAISLIEVRLPCKCYLQGFDDGMQLPFRSTPSQVHALQAQGVDTADIKKIQQESIVQQIDERFPPHFSRREIARPVSIIAPETTTPQKSADLMIQLHKHLYAMLGVTLQRRSMRLDFLFRLIRALHISTFSEYHSKLEKCTLELRHQHIFVLAYLTDGWGDILFTFRKDQNHPLKESDLAAIFSFQQAVYEDFMVDRTEMVFTPKCIDVALNQPDQYRISIQTRMMEDRWLEPGIKNYIDNLAELCKKPPKHLLSNVSVTLLTGRNDFCITFNGSDSTEPHKYRRIIEWLSDSHSNPALSSHNAMKMLGHFETTIERLLI